MITLFDLQVLVWANAVGPFLQIRDFRFKETAPVPAIMF